MLLGIQGLTIPIMLIPTNIKNLSSRLKYEQIRTTPTRILIITNIKLKKPFRKDKASKPIIFHLSPLVIYIYY
jgi:hypothetical protein